MCISETLTEQKNTQSGRSFLPNVSVVEALDVESIFRDERSKFDASLDVRALRLQRQSQKKCLISFGDRNKNGFFHNLNLLVYTRGCDSLKNDF